ncbi:aldo/keto reductase [Actinoplanes sp. CA-030573]|uniref:aldo/keto reductase n=1 Tax=Actinoplanes sp. CA-030573 TaxID=3239898 RepID=UPI003D8C5955
MTFPLRPFGRTGVKVSALALGTMMFGPRGNPDHDDSIRIIRRALDAGINLVDTADVYSQGESETIVGKALEGRRDDVFLATKFHGQIGDNPNHFGNSRRWILREVENSLRRLRTDHIDLYQVHRPEEDTDFDETLGALSDLVRQGKIRYIGTSTFEPSAIVEGQWIAERRGRERVVSEQPPYSILARGIEREVLPVAERYGLAVIPWSPLAGGWLSGKFRKGRGQPPTSRGGNQPGRFEIDAPENAAKLEAVEALAQLAEQAGLPLIHLALAFVLEHPAVTAPIIGPRTYEQLEQQLGAAEVRLTPDVLNEIDKIVPPGVTLSDRDQGYRPPSLTDPARRRRA